MRESLPGWVGGEAHVIALRVADARNAKLYWEKIISVSSDRDIAWRVVAAGKSQSTNEHARCYVERSVMVTPGPFDDALAFGLKGVK